MEKLYRLNDLEDWEQDYLRDAFRNKEVALTNAYKNKENSGTVGSSFLLEDYINVEQTEKLFYDSMREVREAYGDYNGMWLSNEAMAQVQRELLAEK